jgi:hypothetical protein
MKLFSSGSNNPIEVCEFVWQSPWGKTFKRYTEHDIADFSQVMHWQAFIYTFICAHCYIPNTNCATAFTNGADIASGRSSANGARFCKSRSSSSFQWWKHSFVPHVQEM